ncbi:hypothetical protein RYH80_15280 [Halobaculum sp. MBLA0147]|uniref:hypothetical protein n=1 Tax=Halobaculum sp. MBLA0147 TaxID=3079934 RepID=UPI0035253C3C
MSSVHHEDDVRQSADWMKPPDDRILEVFSDEGNLTPVAVSREGRVDRVDISRKYAGERCRELTRYGLLEYVDDGLFRITDQGLAYLDEELDASELEPVDETE